MKNLIVVLILAAVIGLAIYYIVKQKKNGARCIGCPSGGCCSKQGTGGCTCGEQNNS
ncbi:MAG: FeoB-associated Cys-rich membrane protein [Clostridia bacterium]|nr:FeoB-associated Cys-rich membrane protein [Clostridia bacterium]